MLWNSISRNLAYWLLLWNSISRNVLAYWLDYCTWNQNEFPFSVSQRSRSLYIQQSMFTHCLQSYFVWTFLMEKIQLYQVKFHITFHVYTFDEKKYYSLIMFLCHFKCTLQMKNDSPIVHVSFQIYTFIETLQSYNVYVSFHKLMSFHTHTHV